MIFLQTYVFRIPCLKCQRRVRQLLSKLHGNFKFWFYSMIKFCQNCKTVTIYMILLGVYSIEADGESGRVKVTTEIDPHTLADRLEGIYNKRELPCATMHIPSPHPVPNHNTHVAATNNQNGQEQFRDFQIEELQELAKLERLKNVELVQSRTLKMTFNDYKGGHANASIGDVQSEKKDGPNLRPAKAAGSSHCEASSSYGGGGSGCENLNCNAMKNLPHHHTFNIEFIKPPPSPPSNHVPQPQGYPPYGYPPQGQPQGPPTSQPFNAHYSDVSCGDMQKCIVM